MLDRRAWQRVALLIGVLLGGAATAGAGQVNVLDVQFGTGPDSSGNNGTPQQSGFTLQTLGTGSSGGSQTTDYVRTLTTNQGSTVVLTVSNLANQNKTGGVDAIASLDRGPGTPESGTGSGATGTTYGNLLQGFFTNKNGTTGNNAGLSFNLTGLVANQTYAVDIFSYVRTLGGKTSGMSNWMISGSTATTPHTTSTDPNAADFILYGAADATGSLTFFGRTAVPNSGSPEGVVVNGFEIIATPEPGTLGMACCGIVGLGGFVTIRSRRRLAA